MEDWDRGALQFDYGTTDNNGNLHSQSNWIQTDAAHNYTQTQQNYAYDSLNRLSGVNEYRLGGFSFGQWFTYDAYGNRQVDAGATTTGINKQQFTVDTATNRYTNAGMQYDAAGNLVADTYSAASAQRAYDAEGRMTMEQNNSTSIFSYYTYDASGQRTRRAVGAAATWQVYGIGGELVAEYAQNGAPSSPQKEYGYRGGELLVTASAGAQTAAPVNLALGKSATQVSTLAYNPPGDAAHAVDGNTDGNYFAASVTHTNAESQPWWQVDLGGVKAVGSVEVWNRTDCCAERLTDFYVLVSDAPFASTDLAATLQQSGVSAYRVAGQGGRPTQVVVGRTGRYVRVQLAGSGILSLAEVRAWGGASLAAGQGEVRWAVGDHLGTPRITVDQTGALSAVTRHDYLPFGEELPANQWGRTTAQGFTPDQVKQKFTGYERDVETNLNYAEARYHSDVQGRFTSVDPLSASAKRTTRSTA